MNANALPSAEDPGLRFDPQDESYCADPYPFFAEVRPTTPVFYSPKEQAWAVTRYEDIRKVFLNPKQFSAIIALSIRPVCPMAGLIFAEAQFNSVPTLSITNPPEHTRIRRLVNHAFNPALIASMEPFIREYCDRFMAERGPQGRADFMPDFAWNLPARMMFKILGVPDADVPELMGSTVYSKLPLWSRPTETDQVRAAQAIGTFWKYIVAMVADRMRTPRNDFVSELLAARIPDTAPISEEEARSIVFGIMVAGHETTAALIVLSLRLMLTHREAWDAIRADPSLIPNAVEEVLRFESSSTAVRRLTTETVELAGATLPPYSTVMLLLASANRDPAVFANPEVFDIRRANADRHMAFGLANHLCLGAPLIRLVGRMTLEYFSQKLPSLRLAPGEKARYAPNPLFRVPQNLDLEWDT